MTKEQDKFDKVKPKLDKALEQITADEIEERINVDEQETIERLNYINMAYDCNNYYSRYDLDCIDMILSMLKEKDKEIEKKDKKSISKD